MKYIITIILTVVVFSLGALVGTNQAKPTEHQYKAAFWSAYTSGYCDASRGVISGKLERKCAKLKGVEY